MQNKLVAQLSGIAVWAILLNTSLAYWYEPITTDNFCIKEFSRGDLANRCAKGVVLIQWGTLLIPAFLGLLTYGIILKSKKKAITP